VRKKIEALRREAIEPTTGGRIGNVPQIEFSRRSNRKRTGYFVIGLG
jgi:hypothetical protein